MTTLGKPPILIVTGAPGVGKTTVSQMLAARSDHAVHLESDLFCRCVRSGYVEPWKPEAHEQNTTIMRIVADAAAGYAEADYFTIVDGIVIPGWFLEPLRDSLRDAGQPVAYAVLRAPLAVCVSRARSRGPGSLADPEVIERLWQEFADLGPLESNAIDVGTKSPDEVVDL